MRIHGYEVNFSDDGYGAIRVHIYTKLFAMERHLKHELAAKIINYLMAEQFIESSKPVKWKMFDLLGRKLKSV